jgi:DNA (cytosine-5)-methyltransferase 1
MSRPILLDLFCGAGGAAMGYHRAGFDVVGVDIKPQPHFPFRFIQADALTFPLDGFDVIHASPPCQGYSPHVSSSSSRWVPTLGKDEPRLIEEVRSRLVGVGVPYVIENVYGARDELEWPALLCGSMFGLPITRHRLFEVNGKPFAAPPHDCRPRAKEYAQKRGWEYRDMTVTGKGRHAGTTERWAEIMGIGWHMTQHEMAESIPPAYTEFIGCVLIEPWLVTGDYRNHLVGCDEDYQHPGACRSPWNRP